MGVESNLSRIPAGKAEAIYDRHVSDLYQRLKEHGFSRQFLQRYVLPDWWEDKLAANPANRTMAEVAIARQLGFDLNQLREPRARLTTPYRATALFKRRKGTHAEDLGPAIAVAERAAQLIVKYMRDVAPFRAARSAAQLHNELTNRHTGVDLKALVDLAWGMGIPVLVLGEDAPPRPARRFAGIAMQVDDHPLAVLGSRRDAPAWLAFYLAHEMGHILHGHLDGHILVDHEMSTAGGDAQEREADAFAVELLTGQPTLDFTSRFGLTAHGLAEWAKEYGRNCSIDPGTVILIYGHTADRWPVAQKALGLLDASEGGRAIVRNVLKQHLDLETIPESAARFLGCLGLQ